MGSDFQRILDAMKLHEQATCRDPIDRYELRTTFSNLEDRMDSMEREIESRVQSAVERKKQNRSDIAFYGSILVSKPNSAYSIEFSNNARLSHSCLLQLGRWRWHTRKRQDVPIYNYQYHLGSYAGDRKT